LGGFGAASAKSNEKTDDRDKFDIDIAMVDTTNTAVIAAITSVNVRRSSTNHGSPF
jgi:hypothetical protein